VSQHELYSSRIKEFEVRGRQAHPRHDAGGGGEGGKGVDYARSLNSTSWKLVGNFTAAKVKGAQTFKVGCTMRAPACPVCRYPDYVIAC